MMSDLINFDPIPGRYLLSTLPYTLAALDLDFSKIADNIPFILWGVPVTLSFSIASVLCGFPLAILLAILKISGIRPLQLFGDFYTSLFRGTPLLLQLSLIYFATPQLIGYSIPPFQAAVLAFSLNSAAYSSETIRGGILAVDKGQREAAMTLGVSYPLMMWDLILPQAFKNILPALVNETIALLKDSSLVSTIGALDLMRRGTVVASEKYVYFEPLIVVGFVYYVLVMTLTWAARRFERRMRRSD